jgi:hypothetical protein
LEVLKSLQSEFTEREDGNMPTLRSRASRTLALACVLSLGATLIPSTVFADERVPTEGVSALRTSIDRAVTLESQKKSPVPPARAARQSGQQGSNPALESGSFFKTPTGIAVIAVLGAGVGYALYSSTNDRIRSTGR